MYFKIQVFDSLPFARAFVPKFETPGELFTWFNDRVIYKHDPPGVELFQSFPRFAGSKNFHGKPFTGDCDCFTIATLSACLANGWRDIGIKLVGRTPGVPVHIYQYINFEGTRYYLDLTNKTFNFERFYPYFQELKLSFN
jgi:hypothetical protein